MPDRLSQGNNWTQLGCRGIWWVGSQSPGRSPGSEPRPLRQTELFAPPNIKSAADYDDRATHRLDIRYVAEPEDTDKRRYHDLRIHVG